MIPALSAAAAVLLVVSGVAKVRAPGPAAAVIGDLVGPAVLARLRRVARVATLMRLGGVAEVVVGALLLVRGGRLAGALLALSYLVFTIVALRLLALTSSTRSSPAARASCGCFGRTDSPIGAAHVVLDLVGLGAGIAATMQPLTPAAGLFGHGVLIGAVACGQVLLLAWLGYLAITALPALGSARRLLRP